MKLLRLRIKMIFLALHMTDIIIADIFQTPSVLRTMVSSAKGVRSSAQETLLKLPYESNIEFIASSSFGHTRPMETFPLVFREDLLYNLNRPTQVHSTTKDGFPNQTSLKNQNNEGLHSLIRTTNPNELELIRNKKFDRYEDIAMNHKRDWLKSPTTTIRPIYDQIPRPLLLEEDSESDSL